ncbi:MAG: hypothetical protein JXP34_16220 [Planctomycetes bacterium]|nr:hypothetical protein [Planctomycetota bacterium]
MLGGCRLRERSSRFVELFRTTPANTVCPNFFVLAHANGCRFTPLCDYCYLKGSFWYLPGPEAFTNTDDLIRHVRAWIAKDDLECYILNAGNLSDSLAFEDVRPLARELVRVFREEAEAKGRPHALLLLTKGGRRECAPLLEDEPCRNVIVSFSVNHTDAAARFERGAAPVAERLAAARELRHRGWRLRMRIDPMILGYAYAEIAREVAALGPERVTLGTLRAEKSLPRFVGNGVLAALEPPHEEKGLSRYPVERRLDLYRQAIEVLRPVCSLGLCEETRDVWDALDLDADAKSCNCGW